MSFSPRESEKRGAASDRGGVGARALPVASKPRQRTDTQTEACWNSQTTTSRNPTLWAGSGPSVPFLISWRSWWAQETAKEEPRSKLPFTTVTLRAGDRWRGGRGCSPGCLRGGQGGWAWEGPWSMPIDSIILEMLIDGDSGGRIGRWRDGQGAGPGIGLGGNWINRELPQKRRLVGSCDSKQVSSC